MSILTRKFTWPAWKFGVLKLSMVAFGVLLGSYFHNFWSGWHVALWGFFGITAFLTTIWGLQSILVLNPKPEKREGVTT